MLPRVQRFVRLRPSSLWRPDPAETERLLGAAIERVRTLGATARRDRRGRAGAGRTPRGVVPDHGTARPRRRVPALRVAVPDAGGRAGVRPASRWPPLATPPRSDAALEAHLPRLRHLHLRGRPAVRGRAARLPRPETPAPAQRWEIGQRAERHRRGRAAAGGAPRAGLFQQPWKAELPGLQLADRDRRLRIRAARRAAADLTLVRTTSGSSRGRPLRIARMDAAGWLPPRVGAARRPVVGGRIARLPRATSSAIARRFQRRGRHRRWAGADDDPVADRPSALPSSRRSCRRASFPLKF